MTTELRPCPFCGGKPEFERTGTPRHSCIVRCTNCGCHHESSDENEHSGSSWNNRTIPTEELRSSIIEECAKAINKRMQALCSDPAVCWQEPDTGATIIGSRFSDHIEALDEAEAIVRALKTIPSPQLLPTPKVPYCTRHGLVPHEHRCAAFSDEPHQVIDASMLPTMDASKPQHETSREIK